MKAMSPITREVALSRVLEGTRYVATHYPGSDARVNTNTLDIGNCFSCRLAQASGQEYGIACDTRGLTDERAVELGFQSAAEDPVVRAADFRILNYTWRKVLRNPHLLSAGVATAA